MSDPTNRDGQPGDADGVQPQETAEDASTSVTDHDAHQPLVDDGDAPTAQLPQQDAPETASTEQSKADRHRAEADEWQRSWDEAGGGDIEPTVIAPSSLRGPSHDAEAQGSSLEQAPAEPADAATADAVDSSRATEAGVHAEPVGPPELVEPRRPSLSLRGEQRPDLADTAPFAGLAGAGAAGAAASATADEPAPTQAMPTQSDTQAQTQALQTQSDTQAQTQALRAERTEPQFEVDEPADARAEQRTERLGSISVDDETARAAATGTPIVLVETPTPPRKRGARGVGFAVVLLSTIVFGALLAVALLAVPYLFERDFVLADAVQTLWLQPSWLLPVAVFFVAYWLTTLIVNRAGWWAHVLGGFIIAVLTYGAHVAGLFLDTQDNPWNVVSLGTIELGELGLLLVLPTSIATFVVAREVPIWFGGIVSKRGRRAKQRNAEALAEYEAEQEARLAEYEATRA